MLVRGQVSLLNAELCYIDSAFRKTMCLHAARHFRDLVFKHGLADKDFVRARA